MSRIIPLIKQGKPPLDKTPYRTVALASCVGKLMERMINNLLEWFLQSQQLYAEYISGF